MITFKSHSDLRKLDMNDPTYPVTEERVQVLIDDFTEPGQTYSADDYGYLVLIEPDDTYRVLILPWSRVRVLAGPPLLS